MSLDALTKDELRALVAYNMGQIEIAMAPYKRYAGENLIEGDWKRIRKRIVGAVERIDRIVALGKVA